MKTFDEAQKNCQNIFGRNTIGKLAEPTTIEALEKIQEISWQMFGEGKEILTGFKKSDDFGLNIVHSSTGSRALIQPWLNNGKISDKNQDYVRFLTQDTNQWQDGKNEPGWVHSSICEISQTPMIRTRPEHGKEFLIITNCQYQIKHIGNYYRLLLMQESQDS